MGRSSDIGWEWDFKWRRQFFDTELDLAVRFLEDLEGTNIHSERLDKWIWKEDGSGLYTARNRYRLLLSDQINDNQDGAFIELWKVKVPSKVTFFAWRLIKDRLPTKSNLRRRNVEIHDPTCPFCKNKEEDA